MHPTVQPSQQLQSRVRSLSPQLKIYNRNFHMRRLKHQQLQQQNQKEILQLAQTPKITPGSYAILVQRLEKDIKDIMVVYAKESCGFQGFQKIIQGLGGFQQGKTQQKMRDIQLLLTQFWLLLVDYQPIQQNVLNSKVQSLLHIIFCPSVLKQSQIISLLQYTFPQLQQKQQKYIKQYPQAQDQLMSLQQIVKSWLCLRKNTYMQPVPKRSINYQQLTFRPQINARSKQFAEKSIKKYMDLSYVDNAASSKLNELSGYVSAGKELSYHQILYRRGLEKDKLLQSIRPKIVQQQKAKTMSQSQIKQIVSNLYVTRPKRQDVDHQAIKQQQQLKLCTFKPVTTTYNKQIKAPQVKNYQKDVGRMQRGRIQKQKKKQIYDNLGKVKHKNTAPPSMVQRQKPKLILEIKVGQRVQQLKLRGDQQPRLAAKKFIIKYGLQQDMQSLLQQVIEQQLAEL